MTQRLFERAAWIASALLLAAAFVGFLRPASDWMTPAAPPRLGRTQGTPPAESLAVWAEHAAARDPFRLERKPAALRFGEVAEIRAEPERPPRPELTLLGTTGGPPWQGVLAGLQGRNGPVVVRPGDRVAGFAVRSVGRDRVVVEGMDSVWNLRTKRALP
jgi:hypothetical protein